MNVEGLIWKLYMEYEKEMILSKPFNFVQEFVAAFPNIQPNQQQVLSLPKMKGVYIESEHFSDVFVVKNQVIGMKQPTGFYVCNLATMKDGWERE